MNELDFALMVFGPALLGVAALVVGIRLLRKPGNAKVNTTARTVFGALLILFALGVGACYGMLLLAR